MKILKQYWWLLLTLIIITLIFIIKYDGITPSLGWKDKPLEILGGLFARLLIIGALLDQFISVFFPESEETQVQRTVAETTLFTSKEKRKIIREEILHQQLTQANNEAITLKLHEMDAELKSSENSIQSAKKMIAQINAERTSFVRMVAFAIGLILATTGITILTDFIIMPKGTSAGINHKLLYFCDIIFTAAILSGGTSGINQFFRVVKDSWKKNE